MAISVLSPGDPRYPKDVAIRPDRVKQQQIDAFNRQDNSEQYEPLVVKVAAGIDGDGKPFTEEVVLQLPYTVQTTELKDEKTGRVTGYDEKKYYSPFVFAALKDQIDPKTKQPKTRWQLHPDQWPVAAKTALAWAVSTVGGVMKHEPRAEATSSFNFVVELQKPLKGEMV